MRRATDQGGVEDVASNESSAAAIATTPLDKHAPVPPGTSRIEPPYAYSPLAEQVEHAIELLEALRDRGGGATGIATGLLDLDNALGGLRPDDLVVVASEDEHLGTSFAINRALFHAVVWHGPVAYISMGMEPEEVIWRLLAADSLISLERIRQGRLDPDQMVKLASVAGRLRMAPLHIDDGLSLGGGALSSALARIARHAEAAGRSQPSQGLVVIDTRGNPAPVADGSWARWRGSPASRS